MTESRRVQDDTASVTCSFRLCPTQTNTHRCARRAAGLCIARQTNHGISTIRTSSVLRCWHPHCRRTPKTENTHRIATKKVSGRKPMSNRHVFYFTISIDFIICFSLHVLELYCVVGLGYRHNTTVCYPG